MDAQITKNQHYVPQFYLRKFSNTSGKLEVMDWNLEKVVAPASPKSACCDDFFYSPDYSADKTSQEFEKHFTELEDSISKELPAIEEKILQNAQITPTDKYVVASFMSMLYLRGTYMRAQIKRMDESMIKQLTRLRYGHSSAMPSLDKLKREDGSELSEREKRDLINFAASGEYTVETNNASHLMMQGEIEGFANLLANKSWKVYVARCAYSFVTTDNPVGELFPEWTGKFAYGPSFSQRTHIFSLTPRIFIEASDFAPTNTKPIRRVSLFDNPHDYAQLMLLNLKLSMESSQYSYSPQKEVLAFLLEAFKALPKNPIVRST